VPEPTQPFGGTPHAHGHHHSTGLSHDHNETWPPRGGNPAYPHDDADDATPTAHHHDDKEGS
jgi:agmatinase